jgi:hypothetical protein
MYTPQPKATDDPAIDPDWFHLTGALDRAFPEGLRRGCLVRGAQA